MKKSEDIINALQQSGGLSADSDGSRRQQEARGAGGRTGQNHTALVDVINRMFAEFELAYHNQYHKAYRDEGSVALAKKYWLGKLSRFSPEVIQWAVQQVVSSQEFLPSLSTMLRSCEDAMGQYGMPASHDAYVEACTAPHPKTHWAWSHPAVYHAGRAADWYVLATQPESRAFPRFEYHYRQYCARVLNGEQLDTPVPEALSAPEPPTPDPGEGRRQLHRLRSRVGL